MDSKESQTRDILDRCEADGRVVARIPDRLIVVLLLSFADSLLLATATVVCCRLLLVVAGASPRW